MLLCRQQLTCSRFLLIMSLNREWALIRWNSTKTRQRIESTNSEKKKSSSLWRISENSLKSIWKKNQQNQTTYANRHRILASDYQVENQIWLSFRNIQIDRSFKKLDHKMLESFEILKKRDSSYKLELSVEMNIHSVFHTSLLRKNFDDFLSRQMSEWCFWNNQKEEEHFFEDVNSMY
jgi:hypothetical protein